MSRVVDAVRCAVDVQREMAQRNADLPPDRRIEFRIGINLGDIIKDGRESTVMGSMSPKLLLSIQENPGYRHSYRVLAACYAHLGWLDEARAIIARLRGSTPRLVPSAAQLRSPADRELFLSSLREAAGEAAGSP